MTKRKGDLLCQNVPQKQNSSIVNSYTIKTAIQYANTHTSNKTCNTN